MGIKEFLKPEWKRLLVPFVLLILFLFTLNVFFSIGSVADRYWCQMKDVMTEKILSQNNTEDIENLNIELENLLFKIQNETKEFKSPVIISIIGFVGFIDPFLPVSYEINRDFPNKFVYRYYISEQTYNCLTNELTGLPKTEEYTPVSSVDIGINIAFLLVVGYLFFCLILWNKKYR